MAFFRFFADGRREKLLRSIFFASPGGGVWCKKRGNRPRFIIASIFIFIIYGQNPNGYSSKQQLERSTTSFQREMYYTTIWSIDSTATRRNE